MTLSSPKWDEKDERIVQFDRAMKFVNKSQSDILEFLQTDEPENQSKNVRNLIEYEKDSKL